MTDQPALADYAERLRGIADQLEADSHEPSRTRLLALAGTDGLLDLARKVARAVRSDLNAWEIATRYGPANEAVYELAHVFGAVEEDTFDALADAGTHMPAALAVMEGQASPAAAAAAMRAADLTHWTASAVRDDERVLLLWPDGSEHTPVLGLVANSIGWGDSYGPALFSREGAERIVRDMRTDGFQAAFQPDGSLLYSWPKEYDGEGGQVHSRPDDRGLYAIGGNWPWDWRRPAPAEVASRAQAAKITSIAPGALYGHAVAEPQPDASAPVSGRAR